MHRRDLIDVWDEVKNLVITYILSGLFHAYIIRSAADS